MLLLFCYLFISNLTIALGLNYENYSVLTFPPNLPLEKGGLSLRSVKFVTCMLLLLRYVCVSNSAIALGWNYENYSVLIFPPNLPLTFGLPSSRLGIVCKHSLLSSCRRLEKGGLSLRSVKFATCMLLLFRCLSKGY